MDRISRWENGLSVPSISKLFSLAIIYKASPQELFPELWQTIERQIYTSNSHHKCSAESCASNRDI